MRAAVKFTANFESNLGAIADYLFENGGARAFDALLETLVGDVIVQLENYPQ